MYLVSTSFAFNGSLAFQFYFKNKPTVKKIRAAVHKQLVKQNRLGEGQTLLDFFDYQKSLNVLIKRSNELKEEWERHFRETGFYPAYTKEVWMSVTKIQTED
jgi:hypothetical protein